MLHSFMDHSAGYNNVNQPLPDADLIQISQQFLLAAKTKQPINPFITILKDITVAAIEKQLVTDAQKKACWINLYNAFIQVTLTQNPDQYKNRSYFFRSPQIRVAGQQLSLDDIEHGILRHSKIKWGLGYLDNWFPTLFEKKSRVKKLDYRIHFSLNCGAKSCPPIAFYSPELLDKQLDLATKVYLAEECEYQETGNIVMAPALLNWFRGDFGGRKKILVLLKSLGIVPADKHPAIHFRKYDWDLFLENYKEGS